MDCGDLDEDVGEVLRVGVGVGVGEGVGEGVVIGGCGCHVHSSFSPTLQSHPHPHPHHQDTVHSIITQINVGMGPRTRHLESRIIEQRTK
jgi:hypothetical protein